MYSLVFEAGRQYIFGRAPAPTLNIWSVQKLPRSCSTTLDILKSDLKIGQIWIIAPPNHTYGNIYLLNWLPIMLLGCFCCQWTRNIIFRASLQCNSLTLTTITKLLFWTFLAFAFDRVRIFHSFIIHKKIEEDK